MSAPPDRTTARTERLLTWIIVTRPDQRPGGTEMTFKCPNCGTQLPVGSRLNPFGNLGSLGGWTLGSTNVEGGLHSPFEPTLDKVTKNHQLLCTFSQEPILVWRHSISLWTKRQSSQFKSLGFFNRLFLVPKPDSLWRPILDLSKPNLSETISGLPQ